MDMNALDDVRKPVVALTREFRILLDGDFDILGSSSITTTLAQLTELHPAAGSDVVIVDLSSVTFMDSTGLTTLCSSRDLLVGKGWRVYLTRAPRNLFHLLDAAVAAGWLAPGALWDGAATGTLSGPT